MGNPFSSSQTTTQQTSGTSTGSNTSNSGGSSTITPNENPKFTQFRESILPAIAKQYNDAQQPVYGQAQEAQFVNNANNVYNTAETGAANNLARRGVSDSGANDAAQTSLDQQRAGQISNFYSQVPLINEQNSFNQTEGLLGLATSFLGQSPIGQTTTGTSSGNQQTYNQQTGTGSGQTTNNPSLISDIGSIAGLAAPFFGASMGVAGLPGAGGPALGMPGSPGAAPTFGANDMNIAPPPNVSFGDPSQMNWWNNGIG